MHRDERAPGKPSATAPGFVSMPPYAIIFDLGFLLSRAAKVWFSKPDWLCNHHGRRRGQCADHAPFFVSSRRPQWASQFEPEGRKRRLAVFPGKSGRCMKSAQEPFRQTPSSARCLGSSLPVNDATKQAEFGRARTACATAVQERNNATPLACAPDFSLRAMAARPLACNHGPPQGKRHEEPQALSSVTGTAGTVCICQQRAAEEACAVKPSKPHRASACMDINALS